MNIKNISIGIIAIVLSFLVGMAVGGNSSQSFDLGASGTRFPNGISADSISPVAGELRGTTLTITSTSAFTGAISASSISASSADVSGAASVGVFTQGGGIITVSTTSAAYTLSQAELLSGNIISIANTAASDALALTLPATSSWTTLIPNAGDSRKWFIQNLHSDAATTTTITTAAGIQLEGDTANDDVINGAVTGTLECYRQASTDVVCHVSEKVSAE